MKNGKCLMAGMLVLTILVLAIFFCMRQTQFTSPSAVKFTDLEGVWIARYSFWKNWGIDTLTIKSDGTFRQVYERSKEKYVFDSGWNQWTLEETPTGVVRLHLQGGRYYLGGISMGEYDGKLPCIQNDCALEGMPLLFYDPFTKENIHMVGELLLVVQLDSDNRLILHHVYTDSDEGFPLIGGNTEIFHRETDLIP